MIINSIKRQFKIFTFLGIILNVGCVSVAQSFSSPSVQTVDGYPDQWWAPVTENAPGWEVLPQAADRSKGEVILSKRNELGLLSNFADTPFDFEGKHFGSIEGLWQSLKYPENPNDERLQNSQVKWPFTRAQVEKMVAFEAKNAGKIANDNMKILNIKWITYNGKKIFPYADGAQAHYELIFKATAQKVLQNEKVKAVLLKTGHLTLLPDHLGDANSPPAFHYYDIAMKIRTSLQNNLEPVP